MSAIWRIWAWVWYRRWSLRHLIPSNGIRPLSAAGHFECDGECNAAFSLPSLLPAGWYMLEVQIRSSLPSCEINIRLITNQEESDFDIMRLHATASRMSKRLIYLDKSQKAYIELPSIAGVFELQHFKLARVTENFSRSRMLAKLHALHPRYKTTSSEIATQNRQFAYCQSGNAVNLWKDYCSLFEDAENLISYDDWITEFDNLTPELQTIMSLNIAVFKQSPKISIVMHLTNPNSAWIEKTIKSVLNQVYPKWELLIFCNEPLPSAINESIGRFTNSENRIRPFLSDKHEEQYPDWTGKFSHISGEWVIFLSQEGQLNDHALYWIADSINKLPDVGFIYSDEDTIGDNNKRSKPNFKCDWNVDIFYSQGTFHQLSAYHVEIINSIIPLAGEFSQLDLYDLTLQCIEKLKSEQIHHIPRVLYHRRESIRSAEVDLSGDAYVCKTSTLISLNNHFKRQGISATAEASDYGYRICYALPQNLPLVTLIIPTRNGIHLLERCVNSILEKTDYSNFEILIVDNNSDDPRTLCYLRSIVENPRIKVIKYSRSFNYSAINNAAVKSAKGEVVGLINNDIEVINPDWLTEMVSHAIRPGVGAVGARLWYSDGTLQHAGVVLGLEGFAGHVHRYLPRGNSGYFQRAVLTQSFSAVTGACLVVRKSVYEKVGGLNEVELKVACNDIDFCLKLKEAGYRNIWTPHAELYHHESATRGPDNTPEKLARSQKEVEYMWKRWGNVLLNDPAYSPNLSLDIKDFSLAWPPRLAPLISEVTVDAGA